MSSTTEPAAEPRLDESAGWKKTLTWRDGLAMMFPVAAGVFVSSGFMIGALGAWGTLVVLLIVGAVALLANFLFAEMATMFPGKAGGLSTYASEGFRKYFVPGGVLGAFGYWMGYTISIAFGALMFGTLIQMQWFPDQTWAVNFVGGVQLTLAHFLGLGIIVVCWVLSMLGVKIAARLATWVGIAFVIVVAVVIIGPLVTGKIAAPNLTMHLPGWKATAVWLYIAGWTMFVSELVAVFAPEYRDTKKDTPRALLSSGVFVMIAYGFTPFMATGILGEGVVGENPLTYGPLAAAEVFGGGSVVFTVVLIAALAISFLIFMNDASRATAGMAEEGITIKQLGKLNRFGAPAWGATVVAVVNVGILLFVANPVGIILASNVGYILAHTLAVWAFVILRKSEPELARPYRLGPAWVPIAVLIGLFDAFILIMGVTNPGLAGYGGIKETLIAIGILCIGLVFWVVRVVAQDRRGLRLRDTAPATSESAVA